MLILRVLNGIYEQRLKRVGLSKINIFSIIKYIYFIRSQHITIMHHEHFFVVPCFDQFSSKYSYRLENVGWGNNKKHLSKDVLRRTYI